MIEHEILLKSYLKKSSVIKEILENLEVETKFESGERNGSIFFGK
jgi:hypothetical protein